MISQYIEMKSKTVYTKWTVTCVKVTGRKDPKKKELAYETRTV